MNLSDFDYPLPKELIAQKPLPQRDSSRMMVINRTTGEISHTYFSRFPEYLDSGDLLVLNDSRVFPARTWGKKKSKDIEFLFLQELGKGEWEVLCRPAKHVQPGDRIIFSDNLTGKVLERGKEGKRILFFPDGEILPKLREIGFAPLPPYIKRKPHSAEMRHFDLDRYQTVFADRDGSIAAPTAGLHFTKKTLQTLRKNGVLLETLTLDVGLATFQPVREDRIEDHTMLNESYTISPQTANAVNKAKEENRPVTAVGTTSVRAMESSAKGHRVSAGSFSTGLYIYPGYNYQIVDRLLTNFHLPKSTLLMLVSAFAGYELAMSAYTEAVLRKYRFFSYGDCMFIF